MGPSGAARVPGGTPAAVVVGADGTAGMQARLRRAFREAPLPATTAAPHPVRDRMTMPAERNMAAEGGRRRGRGRHRQRGEGDRAADQALAAACPPRQAPRGRKRPRQDSARVHSLPAKDASTCGEGRGALMLSAAGSDLAPEVHVGWRLLWLPAETARSKLVHLSGELEAVELPSAMLVPTGWAAAVRSEAKTRPTEGPRSGGAAWHGRASAASW